MDSRLRANDGYAESNGVGVVPTQEVVHRRSVNADSVSVIASGGKRYRPKVLREASVLPVAFLGGRVVGGGYGVIGSVRGLRGNVGGCCGMTGRAGGGAGRGLIGVAGTAAWAAYAAARASLIAISPRTQARPAWTAFQGRLSFVYFFSKYGSTRSAQSVAQSTNSVPARGNN